MKIGVFDSGVGGKSVADALGKAFPNYEVLFINDKEHLPYGSKTPDELTTLVKPHLDYLVRQNCDIIVVACNTVSCTILPDIKHHYPVPVVGIVPMVKPASSLTKSKIIAVFATPTTLASKRYAELKEEFAVGITVLEPDCSDWALMIETATLDKEKVRSAVLGVCDSGVDVIVLGCTHYHWIEQIIIELAEGQATVIQPESAVVAHVRELIETS